MQSCVLCGSEQLNQISHRYSLLHHCGYCDLIFKDCSHYISPQEERSRYCLHENSINDEGYVNFLSQVIDPSLKILNAQMRILDYGCGPGPTLSKILNQKGYFVFDFDPIFSSDLKEGSYDFIFSTEVFEHFRSPKAEIGRIKQLMSNKAYLAIMTELRPVDISNWYYIKDPTHLSFYSRETINYIKDRFNLDLIFTDNKRVIIFRNL